MIRLTHPQSQLAELVDVSGHLQSSGDTERNIELAHAFTAGRQDSDSDDVMNGYDTSPRSYYPASKPAGPASRSHSVSPLSLAEPNPERLIGSSRRTPYYTSSNPYRRFGRYASPDRFYITRSSRYGLEDIRYGPEDIKWAPRPRDSRQSHKPALNRKTTLVH